MKTSKILVFLLVAIITIISFSACTSSKVETTNGDQDAASETQENVDTEDVNEDPNDNDKDTTTADELLDQQLFAQATEQNDASICEDILDNALKNDCSEIVDANSKISEAMKTKDKAICESIELDRYKESCVANIDRQEQKDIERMEKQQEAQEKADEVAAISKQAFDSQDLNTCNQIDDENQKNACIFNILVNQAENEKNPELCSQMPTQELITDCREILSLGDI